jgi:hypothetical protein
VEETNYFSLSKKDEQEEVLLENITKVILPHL